MGLAGKGNIMKKLILLLVALSTLAGCSATSLRCGIDGDSSFVELYNLPQNFSQNTREYARVCGFAYEQRED